MNEGFPVDGIVKAGESAAKSLMHVGFALKGWSERHRYSDETPTLDSDLQILDQYLIMAAVWWSVIRSDYDLLLNELGKRQGNLPKFTQLRKNEELLIASAYPESYSDMRKMSTAVDSFAAHGILFSRFMAYAFGLLSGDSLLPRERSPRVNAVNRSWVVHLLSESILDFMIDRYQRVEVAIRGKSHISADANPRIHSRAFFEISREVFFRTDVDHMFLDFMPQASIPLLRVSIERKIREAIGYSAFRNHKNPSRPIRPISVSLILEHASQLGLQSTINFAQLKRFYHWSNYVVHGGLRFGIPETWFAFQFLCPLLRGQPVPQSSWSTKTIWSTASYQKRRTTLRRRMRLSKEWVAMGSGA